MNHLPASALVSEDDVAVFHRDGFLVARGLFSADEMGAMKHNFMEMNANDPNAVSVKAARQEGDILKAYPRLMHPHRVNSMAMRYMLDRRVISVLEALLGEEPIAAQSMFYFKPPGAKGQALHQDNFYLRVEPGTCVAAWTAVDPSEVENGGLFIVPNSQRGEIQCPHRADPELSFTTEEVDVPAGLTPVATHLHPGDVLFFNGNLIHGSYPNLSTERFRRAFICHYAGVSAKKISKWYFPLYAADGTILDREVNADGGPCGTEYEYVAGPH